MTDARPQRSRGDFSQPVKQMVATASDEQLAWIVGPDRRFYSTEAIRAATHELEIRRENSADQDDQHSYNVAAFIFGPLWYFYHGMIGRGILVLSVLLAAIFGFEPVAEAIGIPAFLWVLVVLVAVGGYCSRFAARDLAESRLQARLTARKPISRPARPARPKERADEQATVPMVTAAQVGCRTAGEHAKALLATEGIKAVVKCDDKSNGSSRETAKPKHSIPAQILVSKGDLPKARKLLESLLSSLENGSSSLCDDSDKQQ